MPRVFKDISDVAEFRSKRLRLPELNVLVPDAQLYEILAIQPCGAIGLGDDFVGHQSHDSAVKKFDSFLQLAAQKNCDVVLTPEYSLPWDSLQHAVANNTLPREGRLWILGCEAITPAALTAFKDAHKTITWIHEPIPTTAGNFLNVLSYLFKTRSKAGIEKTVALLQFKTQAMVDANLAWERDRLIVGKTIYFIHNPEDHIRLITLICSDALGFAPYANNQSRMALHPHVIFHPQMCSDPRHLAIQNYRTTIFKDEPSKEIEVIVLNWARNFRINAFTSPYGGSAVYLKSERFKKTDDVLDANHKLGLYYANWKSEHTQMCLLNYDEHVFHLSAQKVALVGDAALANRTGPRVQTLYNWDSQNGGWIDSETADDGFKVLCDSFKSNPMEWCTGDGFTSVDRERLLTLSAGKLEPTKDWHEVNNLRSFGAEQDERTKRLTFVHEQSAASIDFRREHLARYITLQKRIISDPKHYPPNIEDLKADCELTPPSQANEFRFNLRSKTGAVQGATAIFLDQQPPDEVENLKDKFVSKWGKEKTRRLAIWYRHEEGITCSYTPLGSISDDDEHPASIARD